MGSILLVLLIKCCLWFYFLSIYLYIVLFCRFGGGEGELLSTFFSKIFLYIIIVVEKLLLHL